MCPPPERKRPALLKSRIFFRDPAGLVMLDQWGTPNRGSILRTVTHGEVPKAAIRSWSKWMHQPQSRSHGPKPKLLAPPPQPCI